VIADKVRDELAPFRKQDGRSREYDCDAATAERRQDGKDFDPSILNDAILDHLNFHRANGMIVGLDTVMEKARSLVTDAEIDIPEMDRSLHHRAIRKCLPKVRDGIDGKNGENGHRR
jgi:hypothetical protein